MSKANDEKAGGLDLDNLDTRTLEELDGPDDRGEKVAPEKAPKKKAPAKKEEKVEEPEEDEEPEEAPEEDEEEEEAEEPEEKGSKAVPYKRFQQVNQARREAEAKLAEIEERLARAQAVDISNKEKSQAQKINERIEELYEKVEEARLLGNAKEAAKLQRELDDTRNNISIAQQRYLARQETLKAAAEAAYTSVVEQLETVEPRLDPDHDDYDEALVKKIDKVVQRFEKAGTPAHEALREASELVLGYNPFKARPDKKAASGKKLEERKEETIRRNASTSKKQPADGSDNFDETRTKINPRDLSDEEFDALPKSKKQQLRGDFL